MVGLAGFGTQTPGPAEVTVIVPHGAAGRHAAFPTPSNRGSHPDYPLVFSASSRSSSSRRRRARTALLERGGSSSAPSSARLASGLARRGAAPPATSAGRPTDVPGVAALRLANPEASLAEL